MKLKSPCCPDKGIVERVTYSAEYDKKTGSFITSEYDAVFYVCFRCGNDSIEWHEVKAHNEIED